MFQCMWLFCSILGLMMVKSNPSSQIPTASWQHQPVKMHRQLFFPFILLLLLFFFQKAQQKGPINVLLFQPGIKVQTLTAADETWNIFIVISEARCAAVKSSLSFLIFHKIILASVMFWKRSSRWCLWLFFWWRNWCCVSTWPAVDNYLGSTAGSNIFETYHSKRECRDTNTRSLFHPPKNRLDKRD